MKTPKEKRAVNEKSNKVSVLEDPITDNVSRRILEPLKAIEEPKEIDRAIKIIKNDENLTKPQKTLMLQFLRKKQSNLFFPASTPSLSKIVSFRSIKEALKAKEELTTLFYNTDSRDEKLRIYRSVILATNRINAQLKREDLKKGTIKKFKTLKKIYTDTKEDLKNSYNNRYNPDRVILIQQGDRLSLINPKTIKNNEKLLKKRIQQGWKVLDAFGYKSEEQKPEIWKNLKNEIT